MPLAVSARHSKQYSSLLSPDERARAESYHFARDRRRFIAARGMLRMLLGDFLGRVPATITFGRGPHGKPYVVSPHIPVHFNLSHTGDLAICVISPVCAAGVDIEHVDRDVDYTGLARRFFSNREYSELQRIPAADRKRAFLACWTRKEAVVKATGDGLRTPLDQIEVTTGLDTPPRLMSIPAGRAADWALYSVDAGSAHVATVALHRP